jgi:phosphoglycerate kinase
MANTFLAARGVPMGKSLVEEDKLALARTLLTRAEERKIDIVLPDDVVVAQSVDAASGSVVDLSYSGAQVAPDDMALDIGPKSVAKFARALSTARTVFWNGPMGLFEKKPFSAGTFGVAQAMSQLGALGAFTVVGGGDSVAAIEDAGLTDRFSHVSTGGGASLELIEGKKLPGVEALRP